MIFDKEERSKGSWDALELGSGLRYVSRGRENNYTLLPIGRNFVNWVEISIPMLHTVATSV